MISATLDSSVFIRALQFGGPASSLLRYAGAKQIRIDTSDPILDETLRVLCEKFLWDGYRIHDVWRSLISTCNCVFPTQTLDVIPDPPDNRILECAITADSDFIVSEDAHLLRLDRFASVRIVAIHAFVKEIR